MLRLKRKGDCEFIGAYVPLELAQKLRLFILYRNSTLTQAIEEALTFAFTSTSPEEMTAYLGKKFYREWQSKLIQNERGDGWTTITQINSQFKMHLEKVTNDLREKGINDANLCKITSITKTEYEKNKAK